MQSFDIEEDHPSTSTQNILERDDLTTTKQEPEGYTKLIVIVCVFNILLKASYSVCAPLLPGEASLKHVDQSMVGLIFCSYSVSFAIVSPIAGKLMARYGRRNSLIFGSALVGLSNIGFVVLHFLEGPYVFIIWFTFLRLVQGVGTGCLQTANYSILSLMYPSQVEFVCGWLEAAAGVGMCFGPFIAIPLYMMGGYVLPFLAFGVIFCAYCFMITPIVPKEVDELDEIEIDTSKYSYSKMLFNRRILFANLALLVNIFQYTFIDPFLADRMAADFGYGTKSASLLFFILGIGYAGAWNGVYVTLNHLSFRRCFFIFFIFNGLCTLMYGPTQILPFPNSLFLVGFFMFLGGVTSAHTIIPTLPEIIEAGRNELNYPPEILNDLSSGLFNMFFAFGEIFGPLIGNQLYVEHGMAKTCEIIGMGVIIFSIFYFLVCDRSMPWNKSKTIRVLLEEDLNSSFRPINP